MIMIPIEPALVANATRDLPAAGVTPDFAHRDLFQILVPLRTLLVSVSAAMLLQLLTHDGSRGRHRSVFVGVATVAAIGALPALFIVGLFADPSRQPEVAEDSDLYQVLRSVSAANTLLIMSDMADPAQNYARPVRATLVSAYGGHRYYVANLRYGVHWNESDAVSRMQGLRNFFRLPWTAAHVAWMAGVGVTHVLVHDRCEPVWTGAPTPGMHVAARRGS